jgi:ornithine carbamoyltransferase
MILMQRQKHLLTLLDWDAERIERVIHKAIECKQALKTRGPDTRYAGRTVAMFFEKPSLRTITTFQVGMTQMGGNTVLLDPSSIGMGKRESVKDVSLCLSRWVDGMVVRCFDQKLVEEIATHASFPVINALTDDYHPCQALAFAQTVVEQMGSLRGKKVAFIGDGNNVANSLTILAAKTGMHFTLACPEGYEQPSQLIQLLQPEFSKSGGSYTMVHSPEQAVPGADILYSDVWISMGQEGSKDEKANAFLRFQINDELLAIAGSQCKVTHCLPAHRGEEITDSVMDNLAVNLSYEEAENRLHAQKAVLQELMNI